MSDIRIECKRMTYKQYNDHMRVHTSNIRMTYEYIRVTCDRHTDDIGIHTNDIRNGMRMTQEIRNCIKDLELLDCNFLNYLW